MNLRVISICSGVGFPVGLATTQTVSFFARALAAAGASVMVLHCGPHPYLKSVARRGTHKGIPFRYLSPTTRRPALRLLRVIVYVIAFAELAWRLSCIRFAWRGEATVVCLHAQGDLLNAYVGILCTVLRLPIVLETCEWVPEIPGTSAIDRWIHRHMMFQLCSGAVVISGMIQDRIKSLHAYRNKPFPLYKRSVFVDPSEFPSTTAAKESEEQSVAWCGDVATYLKDVLFLVSVVALLTESHNSVVLELVGPASNEARTTIETHSRRVGLSPASLKLRGYVSREEMLAICRRVSILVQPLWDDGRSKARVPNKLGEYLMSGTPVVTCAVGEVGGYLTDSKNALFYTPGDAVACAGVISALLSDKERAKSIGLCGREFAERRFAYDAHGRALFRLFADVAGAGTGLRGLSLRPPVRGPGDCALGNDRTPKG